MNTTTTYPYEPDYAVAPGETLLETIEHLGMTQKELAVRTGLTPQTIVRITKGEQPITYVTANLLELSTGVPARFWNNLEAQYRERRAKLEERERMKADLNWLKTMPVKALQDRGLVGKHADKVQVLRDVLAFYGVGVSTPGKKCGRLPKWPRGVPRASRRAPAPPPPGSGKGKCSPSRYPANPTTVRASRPP